MQRYAETDRSDQDEPAHELGVADGEVHRDAAAERVAENKGRRDLKTSHNARDVVGELDDIRVGRFESRSEREPGQIDDMDGPSQTAKGPNLWREPAPVGGDPR